MNKPPLELEQLIIVPINQAACRKIEVTFLTQPHDTIFIYRMPFSIEYTVTERIESFALPSQLGDFSGRFGLFIEIHLQSCHLLFTGQPDVVAKSFDLLLKFGERYQVFLLHLDDFFLTVLVLDTVQTFGHQGIFDMEHRQHDEVGPLELLAVVGGVITIVGLKETVFGQQIPVDDLRFTGFGFIKLLLFPVNGHRPKVLIVVGVSQFSQVHGFFDFVTDQCHELGYLTDRCTLVFGGTVFIERIPGIPGNEVLFLQLVEAADIGTVRIRIILLVSFTQWNLAHGNGETALHGQHTALNHCGNTGSVAFVHRLRICIRKETKGRGITLQLLELSFGPSRTQ